MRLLLTIALALSLAGCIRAYTSREAEAIAIKTNLEKANQDKEYSMILEPYQDIRNTMVAQGWTISMTVKAYKKGYSSELYYIYSRKRVQ